MTPAFARHTENIPASPPGRGRLVLLSCVCSSESHGRGASGSSVCLMGPLFPFHLSLFSYALRCGRHLAAAWAIRIVGSLCYVVITPIYSISSIICNFHRPAHKSLQRSFVGFVVFQDAARVRSNWDRLAAALSTSQSGICRNITYSTPRLVCTEIAAENTRLTHTIVKQKDSPCSCLCALRTCPRRPSAAGARGGPRRGRPRRERGACSPRRSCPRGRGTGAG
jgi:hypothetical protein